MWGKNKLVNEIEFIALDKYAFEVCPKPFPASQAIPQWWKDASPYIKNEDEIKAQIENITSIPGVGKLTAITVLAETNGFELIRNKRQLASYAGFDIKEKQSGTSIKGKSKISKKGNRHLRKAMHLPSLSAVKHDEKFKEVYIRLISKHGIKMKALIAIQRKLLELTYVLFKNKTKYDNEYKSNKRAQPMMAATL